MGRLAETHGGGAGYPGIRQVGDAAGQNQNCRGMGGESWLAGETESHGVHTGASKDAINMSHDFFFPRDASTSEIGVLLSTLPYPILDPAANSYPGPPLLFFQPIILTKPLLTFPRSFALLSES